MCERTEATDEGFERVRSYSPRLKTEPKIEIQLKTTASAQPVKPTKNATVTKRIIQIDTLTSILAHDASCPR
jgi:hypothetical protein